MKITSKTETSKRHCVFLPEANRKSSTTVLSSYRKWRMVQLLNEVHSLLVLSNTPEKQWPVLFYLNPVWKTKKLISSSIKYFANIFRTISSANIPFTPRLWIAISQLRPVS
jgi:hypothetical protein